jgi:hypothetical protein
MARAQPVRLTGVLAAPDERGRLRLAFVGELAATKKPDASWRRLARLAAPGQCVAWRFPRGGEADDAGLRGECWVALPRGAGRRAAERRERLRALAAGLEGSEVALAVRLRRYSFRGSHGEQVAGIELLLAGLEPLTEAAAPQ